MVRERRGGRTEVDGQRVSSAQCRVQYLKGDRCLSISTPTPRLILWPGNSGEGHSLSALRPNIPSSFSHDLDSLVTTGDKNLLSFSHPSVAFQIADVNYFLRTSRLRYTPDIYLNDSTSCPNSRSDHILHRPLNSVCLRKWILPKDSHTQRMVRKTEQPCAAKFKLLVSQSITSGSGNRVMLLGSCSKMCKLSSCQSLSD